MVYARITLNDYANKVLNVVKAKFSLNDKSEAINKFVEMYGEEDMLNYRYSPLVTIPNLNMSSLNSEIMVSLAKKGYLALID